MSEEKDEYYKYQLRKQYRQDKRQLRSQIRVAEFECIGDSPNKLKAFENQNRTEIFKLIIYGFLLCFMALYAPTYIPQIIKGMYGG